MDNDLIFNEKERKKEKRKLYRDIIFIILFGILIFWFTASYLSNINIVKHDEEINTDLIDSKSLNKSRAIDYSLSGIGQDGVIYLNYEFVNFQTYSPLSTITLSCNLSVGYDLNTFNYLPYMELYFYFYDDSIDLEIDETYELPSQLLTDSNISNSKFVFTFLIVDGVIDNQNSSFSLADGLYYLDLIPSTYPDLTTTYNGTFDIYRALPLTHITNEVSYIISITDSKYDDGYNIGLEEGYEDGYEAGINEGLGDGYHEGYDDGYNIGLKEGYTKGVNVGYQDGLLVGQKDNINEKGFKTLFNAIMNAPYNIFKGILNFEFLGVNLFSLFSFIFTTMLILWIVKIFKK